MKHVFVCLGLACLSAITAQAYPHVWIDMRSAVSLNTAGAVDAIGVSAWLLALSFFYGVVHAAGPGHGKAVIAAYLVGNENAVRRGIILSVLSAAAQGVTAVSIVGLLAALFGFLSTEVANVAVWLERASCVMIIGIGVVLLVQTGRSVWLGRDVHEHGHARDRDHQHEHTYITPQEAASWDKGVAVVAAVGLRPCMGAILVLLFALAQGVFFFGVLATAAISLGTAITVATLAVLASTARGVALRLAGTMDGWLLWTYWGLSFAGGLALVFFGVALLFAPPPPMPGAG